MISAANQPTARHILVVDDDAQVREHIASYLRDHGFSTAAVAGAGDIQRTLEAGPPVDMVILDVTKPGEDGLSICRRVTAQGGPAVILVSAVGESADRVLGLELGADDYLRKPCNPRELLARIRAVFRRLENSRRVSEGVDKIYRFDGFVLDAVRRTLQAPNGSNLVMTCGEYSLLTAFLTHARRVLTRDQLVELSRSSDTDVFDRAIDVQVSRLRRKLSAFGAEEIIRTCRGGGYMFDANVTGPRAREART